MTKQITISILALLVGGSLYAGQYGTHYNKHHKKVHKYHKTAHKTAHKYHKTAHKTANRYHRAAHSSAMDALNGSSNGYSSKKYRRKHSVRVNVGGYHGEASANSRGSVSAGAGYDSSSSRSVGVNTSVGGVSVGF